VTEGDANRKAGIGKVIIGGALSQDLANSKGSTPGQQATADSATIPDAYNSSKFLVTKPGMPPNRERAK
jgi:hypothetical protein